MPDFENISKLVRDTELHAKDAEYLGRAGAFSSIEDGMNELEAGIYARDWVKYWRQVDSYYTKMEKWEEQTELKRIKYEESLGRWEEENQERYRKYLEKEKERNKAILERQRKNRVRLIEGKTAYQELTSLAPYKTLKKPEKPDVSNQPSFPKEPVKRRSPLTQKERIILQRQMLNIYLSGHPLDGVEIDRQSIKINEALSLENKSYCSIYGVVLSTKITNTKTKKLMATLRIEDRSGSIEVVLFPSTYTSLKGKIEEGKVYKITGYIESTKVEDQIDRVYSHARMIGNDITFIPDKEIADWEIEYPLLKGKMRITSLIGGPSKIETITLLKMMARKGF